MDPSIFVGSDSRSPMAKLSTPKDRLFERLTTKLVSDIDLYVFDGRSPRREDDEKIARKFLLRFALLSSEKSGPSVGRQAAMMERPSSSIV